MPLWKRGKTWRYQFQHEGKRHSRGGFSTKAEARIAMEDHRKALMSSLIRTQTDMDFLALANAYLDHAKRRFAPKTYQYKAIVYREFHNHAGNLLLRKISVPIIEDFLTTRPSNTNYNRHRKDLSALFAWALKRNYLTQNPCVLIDKMPEPEFRRLIPTEEEMNRILMASGEHRPFLLTLYHTLARVDEIMRLRWDDVNFTERTIRLWTRKRKDGSWQHDLLPMNDTLHEVLWPLWKKRLHPEWVFPNAKTGDRDYDRRRIMRTICKRAGVRHFGYHAIRHYVASLLADREKVSTPTISRILRHKSIRTTELYLQLIDDSLRDTMARINPQDQMQLIEGGKKEGAGEG